MAVIGEEVIGLTPVEPAARTRLRGHKARWLGLIAVAIAVVVLVAPFFMTDPSVQDIAGRLRGPSWSHLFGTDEFGRDVLVRTLAGARISWLVAVVAGTCSGILGGLYGSIAALGGRRADAIMMRLLEVLLAFPGPLLALVLAVAIGPGLVTVIVAISIVYTAPVARLVRSLVLDEMKKDYAAAARLIGTSRTRIMFRHVGINIASPMLVFMMTVAADAILVEAALSYLGAGVEPPTPSWGSMVLEGQNLVFAGAWWVSLAAGAAIAVTVLILNLLADMLVDELGIGGHRG
jgi:peptide/nickel transport system permease protein